MIIFFSWAEFSPVKGGLGGNKLFSTNVSLGGFVKAKHNPMCRFMLNLETNK